MKKIVVFIFIFMFSLFGGVFSVEANDTLNAYFFYGDGCPHCGKEADFLAEMEKKFPNLEVKDFEIYHNRENALLLREIGQSLSTDIKGVPFLVIGNKHFAGYDESITSREVEEAIEGCSKMGCPDIFADKGFESDKESKEGQISNGAEKESADKDDGKIIKLPFIGSINVSDFSLPMLTVVMGLLDGFNPCAMWALLFLISLLLGMNDRKRMWILGIAFIASSSFVYFMFMSAWLNLILFIGFVVSIRMAIGTLALLGGGYNIKEFITNKEGGCKVTGDSNRRKVFERLKCIVENNGFWMALGGIIILAFMVNLVELICSAGLPAIYTQVLALNDLSKLQYYLYIAGYIFFFMLDDLFVFFVAMTTLEMTGVTTKYSRFSRLAGGLAMLVIGLLLITKPQLLMFG